MFEDPEYKIAAKVLSDREVMSTETGVGRELGRSTVIDTFFFKNK